jgi:hypothetical protein
VEFWNLTCVESRCDAVGLGAAYPLPTLSSVGASLAEPCVRLHTPLIEPDVTHARRCSHENER